MASVSQSVSRCFALFSLFSERQTGLTAAEIAQALDAPRSSVAALLKELSELSMVSLNRRTLTYLPTLKFAQLGSWLIDPAHFPPSLAETMADLQQRSRETVTASWPIDHEMEIIRVEESRQPISFIAELGQRLPLWKSAVGTAFLATLSNSQISARWERDSRSLDDVPPIAEVLDRVSHCRSLGAAVVHEGVFTDASAVARCTSVELDGRPLVLSIAGPTARMMRRAESLTEMLTTGAGWRGVGARL